jgi:hypothetical protein
MSDLLVQDLKICSQKSWRWGRHQELVAHWCGPIEWTELAVGVGDVGQAPKVEDWPGVMALAVMKNSPGK